MIRNRNADATWRTGSTQWQRPARLFREYVGDAIDLSFLTRLRENLRAQFRGRTSTYSDNGGFWADALNGTLHNGARVLLKDFTISEWLPMSPGRYFTPDGSKARMRAKSFFSDRHMEYLPLGKLDMILGGVGTVRLTPKRVQNSLVVMLCATSNGIAHQGIPLVLHQEESERILSLLNREGAVVGTIVGEVWAIAKDESPVEFDGQLPRFYVTVREFRKNRWRKAESHATIATLTRVPSAHNNSEPAGMIWSFASFNPANGRKGIKAAVDWLAEYSHRYGGRGSEHSIVSDFDETTEWFPYEVELPLSRLSRAIADKERLQLLARECDIRIKRRTFVSYRRDDTDFVRPVYEYLVKNIGREHVFYDAVSIPVGADFRAVLRDQVAASESLLALVGPNWAGDCQGERRRIDNEGDWVRFEIETALGLKKPVLPVVVGGTNYPPDKLPETLAPLAFLNALRIEERNGQLHGARRLLNELIK